MLCRNTHLRTSTCLLRPFAPTTSSIISPSRHPHLSKRIQRNLHGRIIPPPPPQPTPFCPDTTTFLTLIGRKLSQHASKIPSWSALFNLTSTQLRDLGIEPARSRKYLLRWREKFRRGDWGVGGDLQFVRDGVGRVRAVDVDVDVDGGDEGAGGMRRMATMTKGPGQRRMVLNLPETEAEMQEQGEEAKEEKKETRVLPPLAIEAEEMARQVKEGMLRPVAGVHVKGASQIYGPHVEPVKGADGTVAAIRVKEGLWEHKRARKVDGGERRKAEVRAKRRAAERAKAGR